MQAVGVAGRSVTGGIVLMGGSRRAGLRPRAPVAVAAQGGQQLVVAGGSTSFTSIVKELALRSGQHGSPVQAAFTSAEVGGAAADRCPRDLADPTHFASTVLKRLADDGHLERQRVPGFAQLYLYSLPGTDAGVISARILDLQGFTSVVKELALRSGQPGSPVQAAFTSAEVRDAAAARCLRDLTYPKHVAGDVLKRLAEDGHLERQGVPGTNLYLYSLPGTDAGVIRARESDLQGAAAAFSPAALTARDRHARAVLGEPGCEVCVDCFTRGVRQRPGLAAFILTHLHDDHTQGFWSGEHVQEYHAGSGVKVYGAPGSKGGVAVHLEQRGLASGPALGHAEKPFGVPFRIAAPPGSDHPGMVAMLLPSQHTPRGCMVILLSLATGDAWLHTGDVRFTEQVRLSLARGWPELQQYAASNHGVHASRIILAVVDTNARRYPRPMGPELPCPTDEQWQGRFLFSFETALWWGWDQHCLVRFFVAVYSDSSVHLWLPGIVWRFFPEAREFITIPTLTYRLLEDAGVDMGPYTTRPGGLITCVPPSGELVGKLEGRSERLRDYGDANLRGQVSDQMTAPASQPPCGVFHYFFTVNMWGRNRDPETGPQLRPIGDRVWYASFGISEHSDSDQLDAGLVAVAEVAPGAEVLPLDSAWCPPLPGSLQPSALATHGEAAAAALLELDTDDDDAALLELDTDDDDAMIMG